MTTTRPVRIFLLVSEQLTPALEFMLHAASRYEQALQAVDLYCTQDEQRSLNPGRRLQHHLRKWLADRGRTTAVEIVKGGADPADVRSGLRRCFESAPDCHWLVNVTGGNKLMSAAAIELSLSTALPSCRVLYREINGPWLELRRGADDAMLQTNTLDAATDPDVPPADTLERLFDVEPLVAAQFSLNHKIQAQNVRPMQLGEALRAARKGGWKWLNVYPHLCPPFHSGTHKSSGDGFERFIGAGLQAMGLRVRHSLKVIDDQTAHKQVAREVDLVVLRKDKLFLVDIKLPGAEKHAMGTQLADVADLARQLGGSASVAIAVRPGWHPSEETKRLAQALKVRLITQNEAHQIFSHLRDVIDRGLPLPPELLNVEQQLQRWREDGYPLLSDSNFITKTQALAKGWVNVPEIMKTVARNQNKPWTVALLPGDCVLVRASINGLPEPDKLKQGLKNMLSPLGTLQPLTDGKEEFIVLLRGAKVDDVTKTLERRFVRRN